MRIVVVSPFSAERVALQQLLTGDGHEVEAVASRPEALALAAAREAQAIVADAQVVGVDGLALVRELAERGIRARVILLCPRASRAFEKDGVVCLTKPIDLAQLRRSLATPRGVEGQLV